MSLSAILMLSHLIFAIGPTSAKGAIGQPSWASQDLRVFGEFFFEYQGDTIVRRKEIGSLDADRMGALRKLSLENQLREFLEAKENDWWKAGWGRLVAVDSLLKLVGAIGISAWEFIVQRRSSLSEADLDDPKSRELSESQSTCQGQIAEIAEKGGKKGKRKWRRSSAGRISLASALGLWIAFDVYKASTYSGRDLEWEWLQEKDKTADWKTNLGDQLSSLQTSSLFEQLKVHLVEHRLSDAYLARVIAPLSPQDLWKGQALKAHVVIEPNSKDKVAVTIELEWNSAGHWIYKNSWYGLTDRAVGENPFDTSVLRN